MGNFEKLSVLVIVVIIVMILVVALYTWQDTGDTTTGQADPSAGGTPLNVHENTNTASTTNPPVEPWPEPPVITDVDPMPPEPIDNTDPDADPDADPGVDPDADPDADLREESNEAELPVAGGENVDLSRSEPWTYVIKSGDTLSHISERELGTIKRMGEIKNLNPQVDWLRIRPGQPIKMPARGAALTPGGDGAEGGMNSSHRESGARSERGGSIATGDYYVSVAGDTIQSISKRAYGNVERWPGLWARNLSVVPNIDDPLKPGTRIFIPR